MRNFRTTLSFYALALALSNCSNAYDDCRNRSDCVLLDAGQGGTAATGGVSPASSLGGSTSVGGTASLAGGSASTGGVAGNAAGGNATGATTATGTGGNSVGGTLASGIGGTATGGTTATTGGTSGNSASAAGGLTTGGIATGSVATGGIGTGGLATGGAGTGGFVSACNSECPVTKPVCNEATATCVECLSNGSCPASRPACNPTTNTCVGCMLDNYCSTPTPACNLATYTCVQCRGNVNCSSPTPACNTATNLCVQCTKDTYCSGATPACNTETNTCVQCTGNSNCHGTASLCDTIKSTCVECLSSTDCKNATASACIAGKCEPCASNADCSHLSGTSVCKTEPATDAGAETAVCVQCTVDDETPCGGKSCNPATNTCTNTDRGSVDICHACAADSECIGGDVDDAGAATAKCIPLTFNGNIQSGYCLLRGDKGCPNPYQVPVTAVSASGAASDAYCGINQNATTCEAVLDLIASKQCQHDSDCGGGKGGLCKAVGLNPNRCTIPCDSAAQCLASAPGNFCTPPTTPWCH